MLKRAEARCGFEWSMRSLLVLGRFIGAVAEDFGPKAVSYCTSTSGKLVSVQRVRTLTMFPAKTYVSQNITLLGPSAIKSSKPHLLKNRIIRQSATS